MEQKIRGIVLRTVKYGDNKIIIDFLTHEEGRLSAVVKTSNSSKSRIHRQLFQPLSILDIEVVRSARQPLCQLKEAHLAHVYTSIPYDGAKLSIAFFVAEFLSLASRDLHFDPLLYEFVEQSLIFLDMSTKGVANFHLMFMLRLSRFLGFFPDIDSYHPGFIFNLREGSFSGCAPFHTDFLNADESQKMVTLMRMNPSNMHLFLMTRQERNRTIDLIVAFYKLHIPSFGELKTLEVLRAL